MGKSEQIEQELRELTAVNKTLPEGSRQDVAEIVAMDRSALQHAVLIGRANHKRECSELSALVLRLSTSLAETQGGREAPFGRIEVFQYLGYNGGFAQKRTLLWMYRVIGVNGECHRDLSGWRGNEEKDFALGHARYWCGITGWPIIDLGRHPEYDHPPRG